MFKIYFVQRKNRLNKIFNIVIKQHNYKKRIFDSIGNFNTHYTYRTLLVNKKKLLMWVCDKSAITKRVFFSKLSNNFFINIKKKYHESFKT